MALSEATGLSRSCHPPSWWIVERTVGRRGAAPRLPPPQDAIPSRPWVDLLPNSVPKQHGLESGICETSRWAGTQFLNSNGTLGNDTEVSATPGLPASRAGDRPSDHRLDAGRLITTTDG